jgi:hypothetical protein
MATESGLRQHYKLATGQGLQGAASGPGNRTGKYAHGGKVRVPGKLGVKGYTKGVPTRGAKNVGTVRTTTVTRVASKVPGFDVSGPGGKNRNI